MNKTETANQLRLAAQLIETGHPFEVKLKGLWERMTYASPIVAIANGNQLRLVLATPPDGRPLHNPDNLTAEQVGAGYRLMLKDEVMSGSGQECSVACGGNPEVWANCKCLGAMGATYRVPLSVRWPEAKPDPYAKLKAAHAAGKVIQYRDANSGGAWSEWHDYDGGRGMAAPMPIDNNGGYREWRAKPETPPFQLPPPPPGMRWHREDGWKEGDLPQGYRPHVNGERNQKGDEWKPIGNNQSGFWRPVINISSQGSNEFSYLYRTTRPLVFQHEGEKWTWHRPGDPMPCDKYAKVEVLYADGKDCDGVLTANSLGWGLFFKPECRIIGWRYAETTKQVELRPEDVIAKLKEAIAMLETLANSKA